MKHKDFEWVDRWRFDRRIRGWKPTLETFIEHWQTGDSCEEVYKQLLKSLEEEGYSLPWNLTGDAPSLSSRAGHWRNRGVPLKEMPMRVEANAGESEKEKIARLTEIAMRLKK
jgi:hypothetical protein